MSSSKSFAFQDQEELLDNKISIKMKSTSNGCSEWLSQMQWEPTYSYCVARIIISGLILVEEQCHKHSRTLLSILSLGHHIMPVFVWISLFHFVIVRKYFGTRSRSYWGPVKMLFLWGKKRDKFHTANIFFFFFLPVRSFFNVPDSCSTWWFSRLSWQAQ